MAAPSRTRLVQRLRRLRSAGRAAPGSRPAPDCPRPIPSRDALSAERTSRERRHGERLEGALDSASEVTARVEDAAGLFEAVLACDLLDPSKLHERVDLLLKLMQRLDREGRYEEALRVGRVLCGLLALLMRWVELLETLRVAHRLAERLVDLDAMSWAKHELGTFELGAGHPAEARRRLDEGARPAPQGSRGAGRDGAQPRHAVPVRRSGAAPGSAGWRWRAPRCCSC